MNSSWLINLISSQWVHKYEKHRQFREVLYVCTVFLKEFKNQHLLIFFNTQQTAVPTLFLALFFSFLAHCVIMAD